MDGVNQCRLGCATNSSSMGCCADNLHMYWAYTMSCCSYPIDNSVLYPWRTSVRQLTDPGGMGALIGLGWNFEPETYN